MRAASRPGATVITPIVLHLRRACASTSSSWLARRATPSGPSDIARRYRGAYQPSAARDVLSERVRELVDKHGGRKRRAQPSSWRMAEPAPDGPEPEQLALL